MKKSTKRRLMKTLRELTLSQNWEEVHHSLQTYPELLSRESIAIFGDVIARLEQQAQSESAKAFRMYYDLLVHAQKVGIEKAIVEAKGKSSETVSPELRAILNELAQPEPPPELMPQRIRLIEQALGLTSREKNLDPAIRGSLLGMLGDSLLKNPEGDRAENIERAIDAYQQAVPLQSKEIWPDIWALILNNLAKAYRQRVRGNPKENLEHASRAFHQALGIVTGEMGKRILASDAEETLVKIAMGSPEGLSNAIRYLEETLQAIDLMRQAFTNYGIDTPIFELLAGGTIVAPKLELLLLSRYNHRAVIDRAELEDAIQSYRQALALTPATSSKRADMLGHLGNALNYLYDQTGEATYLQESIELWQQAVELVPAASPERAGYLNDLSVGLCDRYERIGEFTDLERAIELAQQAVTLTDRSSLSRPTHLMNLGTWLYKRYDRTADLADIEKAIASWQEARDLTPPSDPAHPGLLRDLGLGLCGRYGYTYDVADLEKSISFSQQAVELFSATSPERASCLNNLAGALLKRFARKGDTTDMGRAIDLFQEAINLSPEGTSSHASELGNLAVALSKRYDHAGNPADLEEAKRLFQEAISLALVTDFASALSNSQVWGDWAFGRGSWAEAAQAFSLAAQALDALLENQLLRTGKETWLGEAQKLPSHAAFALAYTGNLPQAVEFLERGRARLLAESQERDHIDLERLKEIGYTELYEAYRSAVERVAQLENSRKGKSGTEKNKPHIEDDLNIDAGLRTAHAQVHTTSEAIRQVPGYKDLFRSPGFSQIQYDLTAPLAPNNRGGVGIYLTVTHAGGLALIVFSGGVQKVWLDFDQHDLIERLVKRENGRVVGGYLPALFEPSHLQERLDELLPWLGDKVLSPLFKTLQDIIPLAHNNGEASPVFIIPTGSLGLLPLHASSYKIAGKLRTCLEDWAFTYLLSARALRHSRSALQSVPMSRPSFFGIGNPLPLPEGVEPLTFAKAEVEEIAKLFGGASQVMCESQVTRAVLEDLMGTTTYLHLSCHARFNPREPLSSGLILSDGQELVLADLFARPKLSFTRLAVLSACQTAVTDFNNLPEEAVGLPAGFLQTGVPGVMGTLWPVNDLSTALLMIKFYEFHLTDQRQEPAQPAQALRRAQLWLRSVTNAELTELFDFYRKAANGTRTRLAYEIAQAKFREYALRDPGERPFAHPYYWAPFAFYGV